MVRILSTQYLSDHHLSKKKKKIFNDPHLNHGTLDQPSIKFKMATSGPMERLQQLENIEKEIAASIQNAGIDA